MTASCANGLGLQQKCDAVKTYFDPKVAAAVLSCMSELSAKQACNLANYARCTKAALERSCADPAVGQLCQIAAQPCKVSAKACIAMVSGLNDVGQQSVAQCVAQGCPNGLYGCIEALTATSALAH
jgi:hypothetical protein